MQAFDISESVWRTFMLELVAKSTLRMITTEPWIYIDRTYLVVNVAMDGWIYYLSCFISS